MQSKDIIVTRHTKAIEFSVSIGDSFSNIFASV